jgi:oligosaccharyltransferase complex subunit alpha (ribophorin I)
VSYKLATGAHLRKIGTVATALLGVFAFAIGARRVDLSLARKK